MTEEKNEQLIYRENPPTFPMGFRFGISKDVCIVDFLDILDENTRKVSYSVAITRDIARDLIENLEKFVNE